MSIFCININTITAMSTHLKLLLLLIKSWRSAVVKLFIKQLTFGQFAELLSLVGQNKVILLNHFGISSLATHSFRCHRFHRLVQLMHLVD